MVDTTPETRLMSIIPPHLTHRNKPDNGREKMTVKQQLPDDSAPANFGLPSLCVSPAITHEYAQLQLVRPQDFVPQSPSPKSEFESDANFRHATRDIKRSDRVRRDDRNSLRDALAFNRSLLPKEEARPVGMRAKGLHGDRLIGL